MDESDKCRLSISTSGQIDFLCLWMTVTLLNKFYVWVTENYTCVRPILLFIIQSPWVFDSNCSGQEDRSC
jgi:hypothetical protein